MSEAFARPALELSRPVVGNLDVAAAPSGGQGLALDETGQIPAALLPSINMITGRVSITATTLGGTGFTPSTTGTGLFTITFTTAFAAAPTVVITVARLTGASYLAPNILSVSASAVSFEFRDQPGNLADTGFHFLAVGTV